MKKCRNYLPVGPWDQIGPRTRPGLLQTFVGGPFVVRSNPMVAVFDNIRSFCAPLAQEETDDNYATEDPTYSSPALASFDQQTPSDSFFGRFESGADPISANGSCGPGTMWDGGLGACVPLPAPAGSATNTPAATRKALADAISRKDCEGVRTVLDTVRSSRGAKGSPAYRWWQEIGIRAKQWLDANRKTCR